MLYSGHQSIPSRGGFRGPSHYNGKLFDESGAEPSDLTDEQKKFLEEDHLRHVLIRTFSSPSIAAQWNNNAQAMVESIGLGSRSIRAQIRDMERIPTQNSTPVAEISLSGQVHWELQHLLILI